MLTIVEDKTFTIEQGVTLTAAENAALTIPIGTTLTNNGTVIPADGSTINVEGTVEGNKINGANVSALTRAGYAENGVTLNTATLLAATGQSVEYAHNTSNILPTSGWQALTTFSDLAPSTDYYFFARSAENENFAAGTLSGLSIKADGSTETLSSGSTEIPSSSSNGNPSSSSSDDDNTPIRSPQLANAKIHAYATANHIVIENLPPNAKVQVYNLQGKLMYSTTSPLKIPVQTKGMYIVKTTSGGEKKMLRVVVK
jgi:hypothetical protein